LSVFLPWQTGHQPIIPDGEQFLVDVTESSIIENVRQVTVPGCLRARLKELELIYGTKLHSMQGGSKGRSFIRIEKSPFS
jgi:hypothetical protein